MKTYAEGIFFNKKPVNAPEWVLGSISIIPEKFSSWLEQQVPDEKGYIRLQIKEGREKPYIELDTYKRN
jgi:hypothetical protein